MTIGQVIFACRLIVVMSAMLSAGSVLAQADRSNEAFGFTRTSLGPYSVEQAKLDWPAFEFRGSWHSWATIVEDGPAQGRVLRVEYPQGSIGPEQGGMQFGLALPAADEYWLSYLVKFEPGFDFRKGGKLPGLTSGGSKFTGGKSAASGEGWSARYMWKQEGKLIVYLYHADMQGEWGDSVPVGDAKFEHDRWYRITQHIRLNTGDEKNGLLETWVDDELRLSRNDIRFRRGGHGPIDSFYFSTFFGGNTSDWAPQNESFARFDDFSFSRTPPEFLKRAK